jgi:hypothetical protein
MSYIYSVSRVSPIQLNLSMKMNTDFESQFISGNNFSLFVYFLLQHIRTYALSFLTHMLGDIKNLKCVFFVFFLLILYMDYSIQRRYKIHYLRHYPILSRKYLSFEKEILEITLNFYSTTLTRI